MKISNKIFYGCIVGLIFIVVSCSNSSSSGSGTSSGSSTGGLSQVTKTASITVTPSSSVTTYGWADEGSMSYPSVSNIIVIDDTTYTTATGKRKAFTNAIASGSTTSSTVNTTAAIIVVSGTVDLSDGLVTDSDHSYYDAFYDSTGSYSGTTLTGVKESKTGTAYARVHGDIQYEIGSNKTIIGAKNAKVAFGGLKIAAASDSDRTNIIIQNITFWDDHGSTEVNTSYNSDSKASCDQLALEAKFSGVTATYMPKNIWIDHCSFTDGTCSDLERNYHHDGSLDIKAAQNVTISYCEFTNHDKISLIAPGDTYISQTDREITFHHNYYHDAIQRMPRSRGGEFHIYNNYYQNIGTSANAGYSLGPGAASLFIVENCYFGTHENYIGRAQNATSDTKIYVANNNISFSDSNFENYSTYSTTSMPWKIPYTYTPDAASDLPSKIPATSGSGQNVTVNGTAYN